VQSLSVGATKSSGTNGIAASATWGSCPPGSAATNAPGCTVAVTVTYPFSFMMPYMPKGSLATISMSSTSKMVISQ